MLHNLVLGIILGLICFSIYVVTFVKGIIFRPNDEGELVFTPQNLLILAIHPIYSTNFWIPEMWTVNSFLYMILFTFIVCLAKLPTTIQLEW